MLFPYSIDHGYWLYATSRVADMNPVGCKEGIGRKEDKRKITKPF